MKKRMIVSLFALCVLFVIRGMSQEITNTNRNLNIERCRMMLKSSDIEERIKSVSFFSRLSKEEIGESLMAELVDYFAQESNRWKEENIMRGHHLYAAPTTLNPKEKDPEWYGVYLADLCKIAGKSGNRNAIPLLIEYFSAPQYLVGFGEEAVGPYLEAIHKPTNTPDMIIAHMRVLAYWLLEKKEGYFALGITRKNIKNEIISRALNEKEYPIRAAAVLHLTNVGDEDLIPVFEKIVAADPWHFIDGKGPPSDKNLPPGRQGTIRYPLRDLALNEISKRKK